MFGRGCLVCQILETLRKAISCSLPLAEFPAHTMQVNLVSLRLSNQLSSVPRQRHFSFVFRSHLQFLHKAVPNVHGASYQKLGASKDKLADLPTSNENTSIYSFQT